MVRLRSQQLPQRGPLCPTEPARLAGRAAGSCSIDDMLSLEEISDRLEIEQLLVDYSTAIDQRRFDDLDRVFTRTHISTSRQIKGTR